MAGSAFVLVVFVHNTTLNTPFSLTQFTFAVHAHAPLARHHDAFPVMTKETMVQLW